MKHLYLHLIACCFFLNISAQKIVRIATYKDNATGKPLGVIQSAWGGTRAEAWTSLSGLNKRPELAKYIAAYEKNVKDNPDIVPHYKQKNK